MGDGVLFLGKDKGQELWDLLPNSCPVLLLVSV